ncbi:MAG: efflux RND transporter permease subunit [Flavobacteriales bacterium]
MLFAIILMRLTGVTGNLMSLGAIDFGLVVDGARSSWKPCSSACTTCPSATDCCRERNGRRGGTCCRAHDERRHLRPADHLIVYIPILALSGVEGKMFRPMALTVVYAIIGAIVLSLTYVPVMSSLFIPRRTGPTVTWSDRMMDRLTKAYAPLLDRALRHTRIATGTGLALLAAAVFAFTRMGGEFIPNSKRATSPSTASCPWALRSQQAWRTTCAWSGSSNNSPR